jgi:hypothetical protein
MATVHIIKRNDTYPPFRTRLLDGAGDPVSLSGATVRFIAPENNGQPKIDGAATPDADQVTNKGWVQYEPTATDTAEAGRFRCEWEVTFASGKVETFPVLAYDLLLIRGDLG